MLYSGNRRLGIVAVGTPDMNPIYSGAAAIDSGFNTFASTSVTSNFLISVATDLPQAESEWPKPCEYFNGEIYIPGTNENVDIISDPEGINNFFNTLTGLPISGDTSYTMLGKEYQFKVISNNISGGINYIHGYYFETFYGQPVQGPSTPVGFYSYSNSMSSPDKELLMFDNFNSVQKINSSTLSGTYTKPQSIIWRC